MVGIRARAGHEFVSTKTYNHSIGLSCAFRQWKAKSHCNLLHGYALKFRFEFGAIDTDDCNWVVDFGGLKGLKAMLETTYDHKTLVADDDPELAMFEKMHQAKIIDMVLVPNVGMEATAQMVFDCAEQYLIDSGYTDGGRVEMLSVEVSEHEGNSAIYRKKR